MSQLKVFQFSSIEEALTELNAKDKGRYFLCTCPECHSDEAFIYKNNVNFIRCNRENNCGERMILEFKENDSVANFRALEEQYPNLTKKQVHGLKELSELLKYLQGNTISPTLEEGYRGLSRKTTTPFIADCVSTLGVRRMFEYSKVVMNVDYTDKDWMCKRNLVFPIYGDDGMLDRMLLRSSIDPNIEPKEIQVIVNPSKETRDFFVDIPEDTKTIVIGEAILDAASFREVDDNVGILALTGSAKTRKLCDYILNNKEQFQDKSIILALDQDTAGYKATKEIAKTFESFKKDCQIFPYPLGMNDTNEFLNKNRALFQRTYERLQESFVEKTDSQKISSNQNTTEKSLEI